MASFFLTNKAVEDLNTIWSYTLDKWSEKQADKYYRILLNRCQELADKPSLGKDYSEIAPNLFGLKVSKHIIFYRLIEQNNIEVIRILHGRMDLKNRIIN